MGWNFLCAIIRLLLAYAINFSSLPSFCDKMAPTSFGDQSTSSQNYFLKSGHTSAGALTNAPFRTSNAC
jgi:hypothetical protein